ncbi:MAG: isoaspartyl peptidase/L-asparaginase family protein [Bacillota bacterium]
MKQMNILMVHGGVETGCTTEIKSVLSEAALAGYNTLEKGLLDAAEAAVRTLEKSHFLNAGYGSVLNRDGEVEMDASIMDGATGRFGAVGAIRSVEHPVSVARKVLEDTPHAVLVGAGATMFARSIGLKEYDPVSPKMKKAWQRAKEMEALGGQYKASLFTGLSPESIHSCDTVGCVASYQGKVAAASSTGGSFLKLPGRVGDTPFPGAGIYASGICAVVCTGLGEAFIETLTAKYAESLVALGAHPQEAAEKAIERLQEKKAGAVGGILVADSRNRYGAAYNARSFPVALISNGKVIEDFTPKNLCQ